MKYNEIYPSFAMNRAVCPKFELLIGIHPVQKRHLTEEEENLFFSFLRYVRREDILKSDKLIGYVEVAHQFLKYFPRIGDFSDVQDFYITEWEKILSELEVLQLAYIFHPEEVNVNRKVKADIDQFKASIHAYTENDLRIKDKVTWTIPLPSSGAFGQKVEEKYGITSEFKDKISINKYPSGFIANYLTYTDVELNNLLTSRQFEELVGLLYENEGWTVEITKKTRDGGKDAIATKYDNGDKIIAYIEAKNPKKNKVNTKQVREFFAVIRDETDRGYFITTSEFTSDARKWVEKKMLIAPVMLELVDKEGIREKLNRLAGEEGYNYLMKI